MARKHKNTAHAPAAVVDSDSRRRQVEQLIEKGKVKEAFKEAKLYFHREASPENRQLVERTYLHRIQALIRSGMNSAGREVSLSMLEFGVTNQSLWQEAILLLPQVGLADKALALQGGLDAPELKAQLLLKVADQAVLHPEDALPSLPELHDAVSAVRLAIAAIDSDHELQALELLQPIPRSSPMADWRYFVRGLIAFRKNELEQAKDNWERLDPLRAAKKVSLALLSMSDQKPDDNRRDHLRGLEAFAFGEPVSDRLEELRFAMEGADWKRVLQFSGQLRKTLQRIDPRYAQRLTEILLLPLSKEIKKLPLREAERMIGDFKAILEPLPWDPKWHRFEAILWEGRQGSPEQAIQFWRKYLQDLEQGIATPIGELQQVQALVWLRIGEISSDLADEGGDEDELEYERFLSKSVKQNPILNEYRTQAVEALRQSIKLDPKQRKPYQLLIENYHSWNQTELMIAALEGFLQTFPDDVDASRMLISQYQLRDEPERVLRHIERLRSLRPLDTKLNGDEAWGRIALARHLALKGRWEEGRAEFDRVETSLLKEYVPPHRLLSRRAAFEFKADDAAKAEVYIEQARLTLKEPAPIWLSLAIESVRYELPKPLRQRFNQEFKSGIARKVTSETAGNLAELMAGFFAGRLNYAGREGHVRDIVGYLKRTSRLKYREPDLRIVCALLDLVENEEKLLSTMSKRGHKLFPNSPYFLIADVEQDIMKGPLSFNAQQIQKKLKKALALAEASQNPRDSELIPSIREKLARVQDMCEMMASLPFMARGLPNSPQDLFDLFDDMEDEFDDEESEFDEPPTDLPKQPPKRKPR
jgi:hypothetical protein